jgi:hypothetical protein
MPVRPGAVVSTGTYPGVLASPYTKAVTRLTALAAVMVVLAVITLGLDLGASYVVAAAQRASMASAGVGVLSHELAAALLMSRMWTMAGALLGTLTRGPAPAVGMGLVWTLVVENLQRGVADLLGPLKTVTDLFPGTAAGSLAGSLGALPQSDPNGTPGVTDDPQRRGCGLAAGGIPGRVRIAERGLDRVSGCHLTTPSTCWSSGTWSNEDDQPGFSVRLYGSP